MSAKRELLLRERQYLRDRVSVAQKEHAEVMNRLRTAEHAQCVTEMEVERRGTALLEKQTQECLDLRHAIDVFEEINYSDEQRLTLALRDLKHAEAMLMEEATYVRDLWADVSDMVNEVKAQSEIYHQEAVEEPEDIEILNTDLQSARFTAQGDTKMLRRRTQLLQNEIKEKEQFEQHLYSEAITKLQAIEEERSKMIEGFMKRSATESEAFHAVHQEPALRAQVTAEEQLPFEERTRRLAEQRYGANADFLIRSEMTQATADQQQPSAQPRSEYPEPSPEVQAPTSTPPPAPAAPAASSQNNNNATNTSFLPPQTKPRQNTGPSTTSNAPPALTWKGRKVAIRSHTKTEEF